MLTAGYFTVGAEGQVAGWLRFSTAALSHYMGQWSSNSSPLLTNQKHAAPNTGLCPSKRGLGGVGRARGVHGRMVVKFNGRRSGEEILSES